MGGGAASKIIVFDRENYYGKQVWLLPGKYDVNRVRSKIGNDRISSVKVTPGFQVKLFDEAGFKGQSITLTSDTPSLGSLNNKISSLIIERAPTKGGGQVKATTSNTGLYIAILFVLLAAAGTIYLTRKK